MMIHSVSLEGPVTMPENEFPLTAKLEYYNAKKQWDKKIRDALYTNQINRYFVMAEV